MDLARFHPAFFFLVWLQAVAAHVEPPTNVTLHCSNMNNSVEWSYGQVVPGLKFRVYVGARSSPPQERWVEPPTFQADISSFSDPKNAYYVTVTAVIGENKSESAPPGGIIFSYYMNSPAAKKCVLDFPSVNITANRGDSVVFHFVHPWLLYRYSWPGQHPKSRKKKSHDAQIVKSLPEFKYTAVIIDQKKPPETFSCDKSVCEGKLAVDPAQEKHCLNITGEMEKISVKATQKYCTQSLEISPHEQNAYIYIISILIPLALIALTVVLIMVCYKKTKPSTSFPKSMAIQSRLRQWTFGAVQESLSVPEVEPTSPTPLISPAEGRKFTPPVTPSTEPDLRLPIGLSTEDEGVFDVVEVVNDEDPGYTHGKNFGEDDTRFSSGVTTGYEKRPVLVELAPDEPAEGYRS